MLHWVTPFWKTRLREELIFQIEWDVPGESFGAALIEGGRRDFICAILRNAAREETPPARIFAGIKPILIRSSRKRSWTRTTNPSKLSDFIQ